MVYRINADAGRTALVSDLPIPRGIAAAFTTGLQKYDYERFQRCRNSFRQRASISSFVILAQ